MQLVAYGAQDIYLTGNPQITFFKVVYRRHTNFAMESIEQTFNGTADFGRKVSVTVSRNGDLISKVYVQADIPAVTGTAFKWIDYLGEFMLKQVEVEIGGQRIDRHYGEWLHIWSDLTLPNTAQLNGYGVMIGNDGVLNPGTGVASLAGGTLYVPLQFWFCRNPGLALPLIALQYHEVKINIEFRPASELFKGAADSTPSLSAASLYVDYTYLDTDERRRFAQVSHEYLIEQLQFTGEESINSANNKVRLNFNHPVKELVWFARREDNEAANQWANMSGTVQDLTGAGDTLVDAKLQLNGHDRFSTRKARYFGLVQPYQHHTNIPHVGIYVYSFALKPEEHQPSGTANFSRIDNATFQLNFNPLLFSGGVIDPSEGSQAATNMKLWVFAVNYNVLRIMSGMGGLAYSN